MTRLAVMLVVAVLAAQAATVARADTPAIPDTPDLPWSNPDHQSSLELLASKIASTIAKRPVTVRCEGDTDWAKLVTQSGGDPNSELGYVAANFGAGAGNGLTAGIASFTELAGGRVCLPLKRFAIATTKPTKCLSVVVREATVYVTQRVPAKKTVVVDGKRRAKTTWVLKRVRVKTLETSPGPPTPCFHPTRPVEALPNSFWHNYQEYAAAILTLAHESIHLGGVVGARLSNGRVVGDPLAEAKAQCYGMQWMPYVAEQLGDTPDDAQAIAAFFYSLVYPTFQSSRFSDYWSEECVPGGALDLKLPGPAPWT